MSGDYEVGYGRPPVQAQFRKGQSANPGGKPGPEKARRQRFARMLDAMLLAPTEIVATTPCKTAFAAMARRMVLDVARNKPAAMRQAFALLDELEPKRPGQRRPRGIDQKLEDAEWADEDASWRDSERDADSPVSERFIEERLPSWSEIAQQHFRAEERSDRLRDRAAEAAARCGSERDSPVSQCIIEEPVQSWTEFAQQQFVGEG